MKNIVLITGYSLLTAFFLVHTTTVCTRKGTRPDDTQ